MLLAGYKGTQKGLAGISNRLIRLRLASIYSHTEIVIQAKDNLELHLPDKDAGDDTKNIHWSISASAFDIMPEYSIYRAGKRGGVRLKKIEFDVNKWDFVEIHGDPMEIFLRFKKIEGLPYNHLLNYYFLNWKFNYLAFKNKSRNCSQTNAEMIGLEEAARFDPANLIMVARTLHREYEKLHIRFDS